MEKGSFKEQMTIDDGPYIGLFLDTPGYFRIRFPLYEQCLYCETKLIIHDTYSFTAIKDRFNTGKSIWFVCAVCAKQNKVVTLSNIEIERFITYFIKSPEVDGNKIQDRIKNVDVEKIVTYILYSLCFSTFLIVFSYMYLNF